MLSHDFLEQGSAKHHYADNREHENEGGLQIRKRVQPNSKCPTTNLSDPEHQNPKNVEKLKSAGQKVYLPFPNPQSLAPSSPPPPKQ
jgi:hypothetical protein